MQLAKRGYHVTLAEASDEPGGRALQIQPGIIRMETRH